jgi:hypothetical protein
VKDSPFSTTLARKSSPEVAALSKREAHLFPFIGKALGKRRHDHKGCGRNSKSSFRLSNSFSTQESERNTTQCPITSRASVPPDGN